MELSTLYILFGDLTQTRRAKALKNILAGRRTVSNLYWALEYDLLPYFGALRDFKLGDEKNALDRLAHLGLIVLTDRFSFQLTNQGRDQQVNLLKLLPPIKKLTIAAQNDVVRFSSRFIFATQIVSEYSYSNKRYYPQTIGFFDDQLIKRWFIQNKQRQLPNYFQELLDRFLTQLHDDLLAEIFIQSLTGHHFSGETEDQLSAKMGVPPTIIQLQWLMLYADLLTRVQQIPTSPLKLLLVGLARSPMANSTNKTLIMYRNTDYTPEQIASRRRIKLTTVYEHLLEAAIVLPVNQFPFSRLLAEPTKQALESHQPSIIGEWAFKEAKAAIPDLSFFEFRLFQVLDKKRKNDD
ncbi:hypothetical protein YK48G_01760 [Lentilactobacillus fungorum]|uniref:Helicase Helix-turn-helix domain-containing protein n=1 Tax=Lentilactobacillus fungorum TaxID=2201250 RepID=A0ABQ3VX36_9LACO|nr:helix-turn-helix domain-containing protein [Lentilactobacillus fungorum]GHP12751.1 hypothetical protein YK48G_01760 [Lentilactobacillus fungorum]